ncbi:MAG: ISNCY family transposase [Methanobrevibacter sp.]|nr:ISNCY family transposase [Methanobrevibacter sp.]
MEIRSTLVTELIRILKETSEKFPDKRTGKNLQYNMSDFVMSAFSIFFMQSASFLEGQRRLHEMTGTDNLSSLFGVKKLPEDTQIRKQLDEVPPEEIFTIWKDIYQLLSRKGLMKLFRGYNDNLLIAVDGTEFFSSEKVHCPHCSYRRMKDGNTRYFHSVIAPALVQPGMKKNKVIAMEPEFIEPQDGHEKQDCEQAAFKRWLVKHGSEYSGNGTILADALFANDPIIRAIQDKNLDFILTCKVGSNKYLFNEEIKYYEDDGTLPEIQLRHWNGKNGEIYIYRYINGVCIKDPNDNNDTTRVNWCDLTIVNENTLEEIFYNSFITNFIISDQNVMDIIRDGRSRWAVENGNYNILKNHGYHGEHNFGHGNNHLASFLFSLNLLAFVFHTVLELGDFTFQNALKRRVTYKNLFQHLQSITEWMVFDSWNIVFALISIPKDQKISASKFIEFLQSC